MVIDNIVKPGKLQSHKYAQCYWRASALKNQLIFVSYSSPIFAVLETTFGLSFYPYPTSPRHSKTTARQTLWALYELGYDYKQANIIIDGICSGHIVKA